MSGQIESTESPGNKRKQVLLRQNQEAQSVPESSMRKPRDDPRAGTLGVIWDEIVKKDSSSRMEVVYTEKLNRLKQVVRSIINMMFDGPDRAVLGSLWVLRHRDD